MTLNGSLNKQFMIIVDITPLNINKDAQLV